MSDSFVLHAHRGVCHRIRVAGIRNGLGRAKSHVCCESPFNAGQPGRVVGLVKGANLSGSFVAVLLFDPLYRAMGANMAIVAIALLAGMLGTISFLTLRDLGGRIPK